VAFTSVQRRENVAVGDAIVKEECAKQSVDVNCQPVNTGNVTISQLAVASASDLADVGSKPRLGYCSESYLEKLVAEDTSEMVENDKFGCAAVERADAEMLNVVSTTLEPQFTEPAPACSEPASDENIGTMANNGNNELLRSPDDVQRNDSAVSPESLDEEKIGFELDAITATDQWSAHLPTVERRVKRLQTEVRQLLFDENGSRMRGELRRSVCSLGGVQRKTRRSPLQRLRPIVRVRPSSNQHLNSLM